MPTVRGQKISNERWDEVKPLITQLYQTQGLPDVMKVMARRGFPATEAQYRKMIAIWGLKKYGKPEDDERLAIVLSDRAASGKETEVYRWGERVPDESIPRSFRKSNFTLPERLKVIRNQELPQRIVIRTPMRDRTPELTAELPFFKFEDEMRQKLLNFEYFASPANLSIDPRLLVGSQEATPLLQIESGGCEEMDMSTHNRGVKENKARTTSPLSLESPTAVKEALDNILPHSSDQSRNIDNIFQIYGDEALTSFSLRQTLASTANNLAGSALTPVHWLLRLLKTQESWNLIDSILTTSIYSTRAIAETISRYAIEVGDESVLEEILDHDQLKIDINKMVCLMNGKRYTPIRRAVMLRHKSVVRVMLNRGADVHKLYDVSAFVLKTDPNGTHCGCRDLVLSALWGEGRVGYSQIDTELCKMLLNSMCFVDFVSLKYLIREKEEALILQVFTRHAKTSYRYWYHSFEEEGKSSGRYSRFWPAILGAIGEESSIIIIKMLRQFGEVLTTDLLNAAAIEGHLGLAKFLLSDQINLKCDNTTLSCAVRSQNEQVVQFFLENGTTVEESVVRRKDGTVYTPLGDAIALKNTRLIDILTKYGAFNQLSQSLAAFDAVWQAAVEVGDLKLIEDLSDMHESRTMMYLNFTFGIFARDGDYEKVVKLLNRGVDVDSSLQGLTALQNAIIARNVPLIKLLLEAGADPNHAAGSWSNAPIQLALEWGDISIIKSLLAAGARVEELFEVSDNMPLKIVIAYKDSEIRSLLLESCAYIPEDALTNAAKIGAIEFAESILAQGADPHDPDAITQAFRTNQSLFKLILIYHKSRYPRGRRGLATKELYEAIGEGDHAMIKCLLEYGADPNSFVSNSRFPRITPFFHAITIWTESDTSVLEWLLRMDCGPETIVSELGDFPKCSTTTAFLAAISTKRIPIVQFFVRQGANVNLPAIRSIKRTPIQRAAEIGSLDIVQYLHNSGAKINSPPARTGGGTALQLAAIGGYTRVVIYLLNNKAEIDAPRAPIDGMTALEGAAAFGRLDTISILLKAGAARNGKDRAQIDKAISLAEGNGHFAVRDFLIDSLQPCFDLTTLDTLDSC